jgi:hypothetical protein
MASLFLRVIYEFVDNILRLNKIISWNYNGYNEKIDKKII